MNSNCDYNDLIIDQLFNCCSRDIVQLCWSYVDRPEQGPQVPHLFVVARYYSNPPFMPIRVCKLAQGVIPIILLPDDIEGQFDEVVERVPVESPTATAERFVKRRLKYV
jgi:hypothetical protein